MKLSKNYTASMIRAFLDGSQPDAVSKRQMQKFLHERYEERFFQPLQVLLESAASKDSPSDPDRTFSFAIMSLCCLLIETLQCYRYGMPTTSATEWARADFRSIESGAPPEYKLNRGPTDASQTFVDFFVCNRALFPGVQAADLYYDVRNGLLHQAQTKNGWRLWVVGPLCDLAGKTINVREFASAMKKAHQAFVNELEQANWADPIWLMAKRRVWWLAALG
jgi:hypothetical protein